MIRELLLALLGKPGSFIREKKGTGFFLDESFSGVLPPEREMVNRICRIGYLYFSISQHTQRVLSPSNYSSERPPGDYLYALCCAVENILSLYRQQILKFEQIYLQTPPLPLAHVYAVLSKSFELVFSSLHSFLQSLALKEPQVGAYFHLIQSYLDCGNPSICHYFSHLQQYCLRVFILQLERWLYDGFLRDPFDEFFLSIESPLNSESISLDFFWNKRFSIRPTHLPFFLTPQLAEDILFCGKSVALLFGEFFLDESNGMEMRKVVADTWISTIQITLDEMEVGANLGFFQGKRLEE